MELTVSSAMLTLQEMEPWNFSQIELKSQVNGHHLMAQFVM